VELVARGEGAVVKVTFINPSMTGRRTAGPFEPLTFAALAAVTPPDVERVLYDECVEPLPLDEATGLVGLSVSTWTARRAYQIARHYRARGVPVVMGGYHPTLAPREALGFADAIVLGEAEAAWPRVVADARAGRLRRIYRSPNRSLDGLRFDRSLFDGKPYQPIRLVQFGRGCRFRCDFCAIPRFFQERRLQRPVREVIEEIEGLGRGHLFFVDDNLHVGTEGTSRLLDELVPLRRRWTCQASLDVAEDPALVRRLARAGCFAVLIGFESLEPRTLSTMGKTWHRGRAHYEALARRLLDAGILVYGTFVLGYDSDTPAVVEGCLEFAERARLFLAAFNLLTPLPGTPIHARLRAEGRLIGDPWWLDPATRFGRSVFRPAGMTKGEFEDGVHAIRTRFYGVRGILRRAAATPGLWRSPRRMGLYLAASFIYRREVHRLLDAPLGDPDDSAPLTPAACPGGA
jgi:radical SAM superfamily enzyme YgiQ (UPF0313 family)